MPMSGYLDAGTVDRLMGVRFNCYRTPDSWPDKPHPSRSARTFIRVSSRRASINCTHHVSHQLITCFLQHILPSQLPVHYTRARRSPPPFMGSRPDITGSSPRCLQRREVRSSHAPLSWRPCVYRLHKLRVESLTRASMASNRLCRRRPAEHEISDESTYSNSQHDPAIVCHEKQPSDISPAPLQLHAFSDLHDEERVKHLHRVEYALDNLGLLFRGAANTSSWSK